MRIKVPRYAKDPDVRISYLLAGWKITPHWKVKIQDKTTRSIQSDLDLHCPQMVSESRFEAEATETKYIRLLG